MREFDTPTELIRLTKLTLTNVRNQQQSKHNFEQRTSAAQRPVTPGRVDQKTERTMGRSHFEERTIPLLATPRTTTHSPKIVDGWVVLELHSIKEQRSIELLGRPREAMHVSIMNAQCFIWEILSTIYDFDVDDQLREGSQNSSKTEALLVLNVRAYFSIKNYLTGHFQANIWVGNHSKAKNFGSL